MNPRLTMLLLLMIIGSGCANTPTVIHGSTAKEIAAASQDQHASTATIITYNVLKDPVHEQERFAALSEILQASDADIIALQEVAPWFLTALDKQPWMAHYHSPMADGKRTAPGGLLILSKQPITAATNGRIPSWQRRHFLIAETQVAGVTVAVANCHLESPLRSGKRRATQMDIFFTKLASFDHAIFLGDFNFGDGEQPETKTLRPGYLDAWTQTQADAPGYTWDMEKSHMAKEGAYRKEKSRRLDRILIRSDQLTPMSAVILGDQRIQGHKDLFPSDHFGLLSTLKTN